MTDTRNNLFRCVCTLGFLVLAFTSCAPRRDINIVLPTVGAPAEWQANSAQVTITEGIRATWWKGFASVELNDLIVEALSNNYDLHATAAAVQAAAAQARVATSKLWPQVDADGTAARRKQNFIGFPIPGQSGGPFASTTTNSYGVSMNLSWELDLWGRLRQQRRGDLAEFQASQADYAAAQLSLAAQVSKAWFTVIESREQLRLATATHASWDRTTEQIEHRYRRGIIDPLALRQSRSNMNSSEATQLAAEFRLTSAKRQIELLLRRYPGANLNTMASLPQVTGQIPAGIPTSLISRRPDLAAAERRLRSAGASVGSARASLYPGVNLTGSTGTSSNALNDLLDGNFSVWALAAAITQPIFHGGQLRAQVAQAEAREEQSWNTFASAVLFALAEVENALDHDHLLSRQEEALRKASEEAASALNLARDQYARGVIRFIDLLENQRTAFELESQYLTTQNRRLAARVDLYVALGGGFSVQGQKTPPAENKTMK